MTRVLAAAVAAIAAVALLPVGAAEAARPPEAETQAGPAIELIDQTPVVARGRRWDVRVRLQGVPADGFLQTVVYSALRSREELEETRDDDDLGIAIFNDSRDRVDSLPRDGSGAVTSSLVLEPSDAPVAISLTPGRTYPVVVQASDAAGEVLASLLTYLIVLPDQDDGSQSLAVAVVSDLRSAPQLRADGSAELTAQELAELDAAATALGGTDTPATLAITPELVDALASSEDAEAASTLERLRNAVRSKEVLARAYVELSAQSLVEAGLGDQLRRQLDRGAAAVAPLEVPPAGTVWFGDQAEAIGESGATLLASAGIRHLLIDETTLEESERDTDLTRPVTLDLASDAGLDALVVDDTLGEGLRADVEPALAAQQLLAELALLWREDPAEGRGAVVVADPRTSPDAVALLLDHLDAPGMLDATTLSGLFEAVEVATDPSGAPIERDLADREAEPIGLRLADRLRTVQSRLAGYHALVGAESPQLAPVRRHLLVASASGLGRAQRLGHVDAAASEIEATVEGIALPGDARITLTARSGTVPLTITRSTDFPVTVEIRLDSTKLEFPDGETRVVTLEEETTRLDVAVRTLASGSFPLDIELVSPDGSLTVEDTRFTIRSTAVSGVGLILSAGAGIFLAAWWGSHWHRARRSRRLMPRHAKRG